MPALSQLRPIVRQRLLTATTLGNTPILLDDLPPGTPAPVLEDALREYGACISIPPLLSVSIPQPLRTPGLYGVEAEIAVHLRTQPTIRARLAAAQVPPVAVLPVEDLIEAVLSTMAGANQTPGAVLGIFTPAAEAVSLVIEDSGCVTYSIRFTAKLTLSSNS
jgi:hypothetical protein